MRHVLLAACLLSVALPCAAAATHARAHVVVRPPAPAVADARSRTLDDIHIEGEIPVPQVLFITARDERRFLEFQHHRYLRTSSQLAGATALPRWIVVTPSSPPAGKEIAR